jgi:arginine utilization protein RocB
MKKIFSIITALLLTGFIYSQESDNVRYVYKKSTEAGYNEICNLLKSDKEALKEAINKYAQLNNEGKVVLSTKEFIPIQKKITQLKNNSNLSDEEKSYLLTATEKYVLVTELIEK